MGFMKYAIEMASGGMMYIPCFMMTSSTGIRAILRIWLSNLNGCNISITDGRELCCALLRQVEVAWCTCDEQLNRH
jgi:coenzyme F420-reducing hydrogenase gamma subunit